MALPLRLLYTAAGCDLPFSCASLFLDKLRGRFTILRVMFTNSSKGSWSPEQLKLKLFNLLWLQKARLKEIIGILGPVDAQTCLDLVNDAAMSYNLRKANVLQGCRWHSAAATSFQFADLEKLVRENVYRVEGSQLPPENGVFDVVVVADHLEYLQDDEKFIAECHRILKASGRLVISVPRARRWSLVRVFREMVGLVDKSRPLVRPGYTESQLFDVLKDGFDVQESKTYSRFFTEMAGAFIEWIARYPSPRAGEDEFETTRRLEKALRVYYWLQGLFWIAHVLDYALFFMLGSNIIVRAKRRMWVPRRTPKLSDGRSIAEAALQSKIGTAAPF
jgi:SAM-dependent methyltransferase